MEFAKFRNLQKNKQSPTSTSPHNHQHEKNKKKHHLSKECTCIISRIRYSTSGARARATSGDKLVMPMLCAVTSIVSLGTILIFFQTKKKKQTFFVSKKPPHLIESKPATVYSLILVERTEKSEARGQQQYLHCGEAAGGDGPRRFPAAAARVGWGILGRQTLLGLGGLYRLLRPVRVGRNSVYRVIDS